MFQLLFHFVYFYQGNVVYCIYTCIYNRILYIYLYIYLYILVYCIYIAYIFAYINNVVTNELKLKKEKKSTNGYIWWGLRGVDAKARKARKACGRSGTYWWLVKHVGTQARWRVSIVGMARGARVHKARNLADLFCDSTELKVVRQLVRQLLYTKFITNNHASFHFWWKKSLIKHQKVSKYYEQDCNLPASFSAWFLKKNISLVIFYSMLDFTL